MKTLQELLEDDRNRFYQKLENNDSIEKVQMICEEELHRIISQYNDQNFSDIHRQNAQYLLEMIKMSLSLIDSISETKIYSKTDYSEDNSKKMSGKSRFFFTVGIGCAIAAILIMVLFAGNLLKIPQMFVAIVLISVAMWLCYLAGRGTVKQNDRKELIAESKIDVNKVYHLLSASLFRCDQILQEMDHYEIRKSNDRNVDHSVDPEMIHFFSELLESIMTEGDSTLSKEVFSQTEYYLHLNEIDVIRDVENHPEWFDIMPGKSAVLRPALVREDKVLQRGLATGVRK